jgi:long-chain acyl-CoA synthetase
MFNFAQSQSPLDMFYHWEAKKPDEVYLRQPVDQEWRDYTWAEVGNQARRIATALQSMGLTTAGMICLPITRPCRVIPRATAVMK